MTKDKIILIFVFKGESREYIDRLIFVGGK